MAESRYYTVGEVNARIAAGNFWYPCDPNQDPMEALFDAVGEEVFFGVMGGRLEAERMRRTGVDPARVIEGETVRKEIEG